MPLGKLFGQNLDDLLGYDVPRVVRIRDGVIGATNWLLVLAIWAVLIAYIFFIQKAYYAQGALAGVASVNAQAPHPEWTAAGLGSAPPYCAPGSTNQPPATNASAPGYAFWPAGPGAPLPTYSLLGSGVRPERYACLVLDANELVPLPEATVGTFLPTRIVKSVESAPWCSAGATHISPLTGLPVTNTTETECVFAQAAPAAAAGQRGAFYVPDIEAYTLQISHSLAVPSLGMTWGKDDMVEGVLEGPGGAAVDPCAFYARLSPRAPCPLNRSPQASRSAYISVGRTGVPDIIALGSLLEAANVSSLDAASGSSPGDTLRYAGLTIVVQVTYDNYGSTGALGRPDDYRTRMAYRYKVAALPGKVKFTSSTGASAELPAQQRLTLARSGIRVLVTFAGTVGVPSWTQGFMQVMSITQAMAIAALVVGYVIQHLLPLSPVYAAYIRATSHDLSDFWAPEDLRDVKALFLQAERVNPQPAGLRELRARAAARGPDPRPWGALLAGCCCCCCAGGGGGDGGGGGCAEELGLEAPSRLCGGRCRCLVEEPSCCLGGRRRGRAAGQAQHQQQSPLQGQGLAAGGVALRAVGAPAAPAPADPDPAPVGLEQGIWKYLTPEGKERLRQLRQQQLQQQQGAAAQSAAPN